MYINSRYKLNIKYKKCVHWGNDSKTFFHPTVIFCQTNLTALCSILIINPVFILTHAHAALPILCKMLSSILFSINSSVCLFYYIIYILNLLVERGDVKFC